MVETAGCEARNRIAAVSLLLAILGTMAMRLISITMHPVVVLLMSPERGLPRVASVALGDLPLKLGRTAEKKPWHFGLFPPKKNQSVCGAQGSFWSLCHFHGDPAATSSFLHSHVPYLRVSRFSESFHEVIG